MFIGEDKGFSELSAGKFGTEEKPSFSYPFMASTGAANKSVMLPVLHTAMNKHYFGTVVCLICHILFLASSAWAGESLQSIDRAVAIDIGHSKKYPGATSARGVGEFYFNERIARLLLAALKTRGMTKSFLIEGSGRAVNSKTRAKIAAQKKADLLISIHHDSVQPHYLSFWTLKDRRHHYCDKFEGYSIFVSKKHHRFQKSFSWATILGRKLYKRGFRPTLHHAEKIRGENRELLNKHLGIYRFDDLIILKHSPVPSLLLECGIIVNRKEEQRLMDPKYQGSLVSAVCDSVVSYFLKNGL